MLARRKCGVGSSALKSFWFRRIDGEAGHREEEEAVDEERGIQTVWMPIDCASTCIFGVRRCDVGSEKSLV